MSVSTNKLTALRGVLCSFAIATGGNIALSASIMSPLLLGVAAVGIDYTISSNQHARLQEAADAAALASVKELSLQGSDIRYIKEVGESYARTIFNEESELSSATGTFTAEVEPILKERKVDVNLTYEWKPFLAHVFDYGITPIKVTASAKLGGESLTCVIGLMQPQSGWNKPKSSIHLDNRSEVKAEDCAVFSNSDHKYGLRADAMAKMAAGTICSAGGVLQFGRGSGANFSPRPITDCPKIEDPLIDRKFPAIGACDHNALNVTANTRLRPGVYCGGLSASGSSRLELDPGVYVIKDGPLTIRDSAKLIGKGVSFLLTGADSTIDFQSNTTINIEAASKGATAGLLFFEDRTVPHSFNFNPLFLKSFPPPVRVHRISSNNARNLLGTIYLSKSILLIDADAPVADGSAYTAIITGRLWLREGPVLTLNANVTDTQVPVPGGLITMEPALVR